MSLRSLAYVRCRTLSTSRWSLAREVGRWREPRRDGRHTDVMERQTSPIGEEMEKKRIGTWDLPLTCEPTATSHKNTIKTSRIKINVLDRWDIRYLILRMRCGNQISVGDVKGLLQTEITCAISPKAIWCAGRPNEMCWPGPQYDISSPWVVVSLLILGPKE